MLVEPTTDRGRDTVARTLDAACELFAAQGVRSTTLDRIGRAARVGRGQLYHFFADKADLVREVVAQQVERVLGAMQPDLSQLSSGADLERWCRTAVALHTESDHPIRCPIGSLARELAEDHPDARAALAAGLERWRSLLQDGFERAGRRGELAVGAEPARSATALLAAYQGGVLLAELAGHPGPLEDALEMVLDASLASRTT